MVASIKPYRDAIGLTDGRLESYTELKTVLIPFTDEIM